MKKSIREWLTEQFGNDEVLFSELYDEYRKGMCKGAEKLNDLLATGDVQTLGEMGHAMKGAALQMGDAELVPLAVALQDAGRAGDLSACTSILPPLLAAVKEL